MFISELSDLLEDAGIPNNVGDISAFEENGVFIVNTPSEEPNDTLPVYYQSVDMWTRYKSVQQGYDKLMEIQELLHRQQNYLTPSYQVFLSHSLGSIDDMDRDIQYRKLWKLTMRFIYQPLVSQS